MSDSEVVAVTGKKSQGQAAQVFDERLGGIEAIVGALKSLANQDKLPPATRFMLALQLDDDARAGLERAVRAVAGGEVAESRYWRRLASAGCELFGILLDTYAEFLSLKPEELGAHGVTSGEPALRLARAGADRVMWEQLACRASHPQLWSRLGHVFSMACRQSEAAMAPGESSAGAVVEEYVRAVALHGAALDQIPAQIVLAVQSLVPLVLPVMQFQMEALPAALYVVEPASPQPPRRITRTATAADGLWFFSPAAAASALHVWSGRIQYSAETSSGTFAGCSTEQLLAAISHLQRFWSGSPPVRRYRRHVLEGRLAAVRGFEQLRGVLSGARPAVATSWSLRDISRGGVGVTTPPGRAESPRVGELVGVRPEDGTSWHLGVVRRVREGDDGGAEVGIETLSQKPLVVRVDDGRTRADVLICDPLLRGEAVRVAVPANTLRAGASLFLNANGSVQKLKALDASMAGCEFELRVYQVL